ncbi:Versatile peroxidase VPL1 [Colletotrichum orbiculare MAFF 240422]|uniref:Peroxidase n=1 Tax=Colletotrichum orbiculare (strain 104-T / ATCC 96160 / CBS 514.97 / LARS 414 / MAFF 240422) TaxID=1213857 RepID=N4V064_COLOR|nr:Versatile peroxidase VPL1 [Colletotrichum orbiculare MAFF 240422]
MRVSILTAALVATPVLGYPGMKNTFAEIAARQDKSNGGKSTEIIGDLATLEDSKLTTVGKNIKQLLAGSGNAESDEAYSSAKKRSAPIHPRDYGYGGGGGGGGGAPSGGRGNGGSPPSGGGGPPPASGGGKPPAPGGGKPPAPGGGAPPSPGGGAPPAPGGGSYGGAPPAPGGGRPPAAAGGAPSTPGGGAPPAPGGGAPPTPGRGPPPPPGGGSPPAPAGGKPPTPGGSAPNNGACPPKDTPACAADTCCIWKYIADDLATTFRGESGRCTDLARAAIRLGFHDAAGWSKGTGNLGGADGSIILASSELPRAENKGLEEIVEQTKVWFEKYKQYGIGMADLIQFSANAATVVCPLGPRVRTFVGRKDSSVEAPPNLLPDVNSPADVLIDLFSNKTISSYGLISLLGAHTTSQQRFVDPSRAGDPQDSTPGVWDVKFYSETIGDAPPRVFKFNSDVALAKYPSTSAQFAAFAGPGGQAAWNAAYAHEYVRLSLLGVYNINDLTECTKALPARWAPSGFKASDQGNVDTWVSSKGPVPKIPDEIRGGKPIGPPPRPAGPGAPGNGPAPPTAKGVAPGGQYGNGGGAPPAPNGNGPASPPKGNAAGGQYGGGGTPPKGNSPPVGNVPSAPTKGNSPGGQYGGSGSSVKSNSSPAGNGPSAPPKGNSPSGQYGGGGSGGGAPPKGNSSPPSKGSSGGGGGGGRGGYGY